ncbi:nuclease A inhibitor family protein [Candidatus Chloroploca sp. Khr17]|uniref:nuclease A inhibitor family protein n=1 Tax=Candidatus Chloroploca sp. Khr17 TaxID=2496869 RepID=UPI00101D8430|nr:nuclease A inhibitor family protein [Candidatus Chloroploca sp. Khr17]
MRVLGWLVVVLTCTLAFAYPSVGARPSSAPSQAFLPLIRSPYPNPDLAALAQAAEGLLYPSEIDAPLDPFAPPAYFGLAPSQVCLALADGAPMRLLDADAFLAAPARAEPWMSPEQLAQAARFATLREVFRQRLANPVACRIGGYQADVFLLGISSTGHIVGLHTVVVET